MTYSWLVELGKEVWWLKNTSADVHDVHPVAVFSWQEVCWRRYTLVPLTFKSGESGTERDFISFRSREKSIQLKIPKEFDMLLSCVTQWRERRGEETLSQEMLSVTLDELKCADHTSLFAASKWGKWELWVNERRNKRRIRFYCRRRDTQSHISDFASDAIPPVFLLLLLLLCIELQTNFSLIPDQIKTIA